MWQTADKIKIVFNNRDYTIMHNGKKYPMAFVVVNDVQLDTAKKWASLEVKGIDKNIKIIEVDNKDFTLSLAKAPDKSWSQGGALSFCNCIIEKKGIPPFAVGINTEYLFENIFETTLINGVFQDKVIFAKQHNNTGAIVVGSSIYNEVMADNITREKVKTGKKTKTWIRGSVYATPTISDLYLGEFNSQLDFGYKNSFTINIYQNPTKVLVFAPYNAAKSINENVAFVMNYHTNNPIPARVCTAEVIHDDANYIENLKNSYYDGFKTTILNNELNYTTELIKRAFYFYDIDPKYTKKLLTLLLDIRKKYPDSFNNYEEDDITKINVTWNGKSYTHKTFDDCIKNFINII